MTAGSTTDEKQDDHSVTIDELYNKYHNAGTKKEDENRAMMQVKQGLRNQLSEFKNLPTNQVDSDIDTEFHSFSHLSGDHGERDISLSNGQQAMDELIRKWEIQLNDKESEALNRHF